MLGMRQEGEEEMGKLNAKGGIGGKGMDRSTHLLLQVSLVTLLLLLLLLCPMQ